MEPNLSTSASTIEKYTQFNKLDFSRVTLDAYEGKCTNWQLAEPPLIDNILSYKVRSLPQQIQSTLLSIKKQAPYLFWESEWTSTNYYISLLALKLYFEFQLPLDFSLIDPIRSYLRSDEEIEIYSKKILAFNLGIKLLDYGQVSVKQLHEAFMLCGLKYYEHYKSFAKFLNKYRYSGDVSLFLNASRNKPKPWLKKYGDEHISKIGDEYRKAESYTEIQKTLKSYSEDQNIDVISRSTIFRIIKDNRIKQEFAEARHGPTYVRNNYCSYVERDKPDYKMQVVEADGSRIQLPYTSNDDSNYKVKYLTLYVLIDVASGKILGYSIDDYENKDMVFLAYFMMINQYQRLPFYLRIDRSSAHQSKRFKRFLKLASKKGMTHKICYSPTEKGFVESFYRWFPEKICKKFDNYTGLSLVSRNWNNLPNKELVDQILKSKTKLPTREQLMLGVPGMINDYNNLEKYNSTIFPNKRFAQLDYKDAIFIEMPEATYLCWRIKSVPRFGKNTIKVSLGNGKCNSYKVTDNDCIIDQLLGEPFYYSYLETQPECIYLFNEQGNFLCTASKKRRYKDDPSLMTTKDHEAIKKENRENYELIKAMRKRVAERLKIIQKSKKKLIPHEVNTMRSSDKHSQFYSEQEFINQHIINNHYSIIDSPNNYEIFGDHDDLNPKIPDAL